MIVYFSASARELKEKLPLYRKIIDIIYSLGHTIALEWVEPAGYRIARGEVFGDLKSIVRDAQAGIESAETVIAEVSGGSAFGVGYEVALALQRRKPVLLLVDEARLQDSYATGLINKFITLKAYNDRNLEKIIEDFIKDNTLKTKDLRFNFVINREIHNHLRLKSFETGRTRAEILRDLLIDDIKKAN